MNGTTPLTEQVNLRVRSLIQRLTWQDGMAALLTALFVASFVWLTFRQYATFDLVTPDVATFGQAVYNTIHGRFLYSTIIDRSILYFHFSPLFAPLAPFLWLAGDIRALFVANTLFIAAAGLIPYKLLRNQPHMHTAALLFLFAYYLNPALHEIAMQEIRDITLAMPFLALALYALYYDRRWLMLGALLIALLAKENVSLIVFMVGVYLVLFRRDWRWGVPLAALGAVWAVGVTFCVLPSIGAGELLCQFSQQDSSQLNAFTQWREGQDSGILVVILNVLSQPTAVLGHMFDAEGLGGLLRLFLPLGFFLPFIGADYFLLAVPTLSYLLLSSAPTLHSLRDWYLASVLPVAFTATAVGLTRLPQKWRTRDAIYLAFMAALGFYGYTIQAFNPQRYVLTPRHELATAVLDNIPPTARVAAQDAFLSHLSQRETLFLYRFFSDKDNVEYLVLGRDFRSYPYDSMEIGYEIDNLVADPTYTIDTEADGIYIFRTVGNPLPSLDTQATAEESITLDKAEVALADQRGIFQPLTSPTEQVLQPGDTLRVTLYWSAEAKPVGERTVSVRLADVSGALVAQQDMQPSHGARPTSWWEPGWYFRDVYYLTVADGAQTGPAQLSVLLYDSFTQEPVYFAGHTAPLPLTTLTIE